MNRIALIVCAGFVSISAFAADTVDHPGRFAVYAGANIGTVTTSSTISINSTTGFVLGTNYAMPIAPSFEFVPGIQFIERGFGYNSGTVFGDVEFNLNYIEAPLLFRALFATGSATPYFTAGPNFGVKVGRSCSVERGTCTVNSDTTKSIHFGLDIGLGSEFALSQANQGSLGIELRYHLGLTALGDTGSAKHRGFAILASYRF